MERPENTCTGSDEESDEAQAQVDIWNYVYGYVDMAVVKCAIELGIPDILGQGRGGPMSLSELSSSIGCTSSAFLYRIMRFLVHRRVFKEHFTTQGTSLGYSQTHLSRLLMKKKNNKDTSMASFVLLESSPVMLAPWHNLSSRVLANESNTTSAFECAHGGKDVWSYAATDPTHSKLINDAMACDARVGVRAAIHAFPELLHGLNTVVDVGGGDGTAMSIFVKAFPWIRAINFDLPHVVSCAAKPDSDDDDYDLVEHIGGDMFDSVPKADAAFLMKVLHDWGDEECIRILRNCREAIPNDGKGKVIILEAVIEDEQVKKDEHEFVRLMLDMVMMAHTNTGKERTSKEWDHILTAAGFSTYTINRIKSTNFVIQAYPC